MISALLLDLDHTLLDNPNETFLPALFKLMAARFSPVVPADRFEVALQEATGAMLADPDPERTLLDVFDETFSTLTGLPRADIDESLSEFYNHHFPALESLTSVRPEARELVEWAIASGLHVCVATNPVYPMAAIDQRLDWAGISSREFNYAWVPSIETMHFGKPRPEYYAEILALIQVRPSEALMVGDDWRNDILPASAAGLHTYWIKSPGSAPAPGGVELAGGGTLGQFLTWARDDRCLEVLPHIPPSPPSLMVSLAGNLAGFYSLAGRVADWQRQPAPGEWSLTQVLCHLRDVEIEVNLPRLQRLWSETDPFVSAADTDPWAVERNYQAQDGPAALREFASARKATLEFLRGRSVPAGRGRDGEPDDFWKRSARHSILGRTTPAELISFTLEHDRIHLSQINSLRDTA
jgi:HAD superfamily hydrolase (TIGR01549 family)